MKKSKDIEIIIIIVLFIFAIIFMSVGFAVYDVNLGISRNNSNKTRWKNKDIKCRIC